MMPSVSAIYRKYTVQQRLCKLTVWCPSSDTSSADSQFAGRWMYAAFALLARWLSSDECTSSTWCPGFEGSGNTPTKFVLFALYPSFVWLPRNRSLKTNVAMYRTHLFLGDRVTWLEGLKRVVMITQMGRLSNWDLWAVEVVWTMCLATQMLNTIWLSNYSLRWQYTMLPWSWLATQESVVAWNYTWNCGIFDVACNLVKSGII